MNTRRKIALGGALAAIAGAGIALFSILGWSSIGRPWGFGLGFVFGVCCGRWSRSGAVRAVGVQATRLGKSEKEASPSDSLEFPCFTEKRNCYATDL